MPDAPAPTGALIGSTINALPLATMFGVPAKAFADTQVMLSRQYYEFIQQVGLEDVIENGVKTGKRQVIMVEAIFKEPSVDSTGKVTGTTERSISVPLLSILEHPNVNVVEAGVEFELTIQTTEESSTKTEAEGKADITVGWGPFKAAVSARMSHNSSQTRKSDTRARYAVHMKLAKGPMPEGMARFMDIITDAVAQSAKKPTLPAPAGG